MCIVCLCTLNLVFISVHEMKTSVYFQKPLKVLILKGLMVGLGGLEPPTSPLSGVRSNQAELQTRFKRKRILTFIYER